MRLRSTADQYGTKQIALKSGHINGQDKGKMGGEKKKCREYFFFPRGTAGLWPRKEQYSNLLITKMLFNLLLQTSGIGR